MNTQLENDLRALFAEEADRAPRIPDLAERAVRDVVRHRRAVAAGLSLAAASVAVAAVLGASVLDGDAARDPGIRAGGPSVSAPASPAGAVDLGNESCVELYSPGTLAHRAFAFDGVVTDIGPGRTNVAGKGRLDVLAVTFDVQEWFAGGAGETVTVDIPGHAGEFDSSGEMSELPPPFGIGSRLLIRGEPRWGGDPLGAPIAWGCGFSRYYDEQTAAAWREVSGARHPAPQ